jgi:CHAD domain-containing protein
MPMLTLETSTLGEYAYLVLEHHVAKVSKQVDKLQKLDELHPDQPEVIHQLRVGLRRLQTAVVLFAPGLVLPKSISLDRIQTITRPFGRVRDRDVLQIHLQADILPQLPEAEQQFLQQKLLLQLQKQRQSSWQKAQKMLVSGKFERFQTGLQDWLTQPQYHPWAEIAITTVAIDLLVPLLSQVLLHPGWMVPDQLPLDREPERSLHDLRKQVKGLRYAAEQLQDVLMPGLAPQVSTWADLQDLLGHLHDRALLAAWLDRYCQIDLDSTLPALSQLLQTQTMQAWQQWQPIRQQYLEPGYRQHLRDLLRLAEPHEPQVQT